MNTERSVHEAIDRCLDRQLTFACWRAPDSAIHLAVQHAPGMRACSLEALSEERNVFVLSPFHGPSTFVLRPDLVMTFDKGVPPPLDILDDPQFRGSSMPRKEKTRDLVDHQGYVSLVAKARAAILGGELEKVVISRTLVQELGGISPADLFLEGCRRQPDAFLCLVHAPECGIWSGASPERLLRAEDGRVEVDAIAGTLPARTAPADPAAWGAKERREQEVVTRAVLDAFLGQDVREVTVRGPEVLAAGPVSHLHSRISGSTVPEGLARLVKALHPTPAVCGTPRENALAFILANEAGERGLYAGFWGPWQWYGRTELVVNIRCLQVLDRQAMLHVGGGIMADSDPQAEWLETEVKSAIWRDAIDAVMPG